MKAKKDKKIAAVRAENKARKERGEPLIMPPKGIVSAFAVPAASKDAVPKVSSKSTRKRSRPVHPATDRIQAKSSRVEEELEEGVYNVLEIQAGRTPTDAGVSNVLESAAKKGKSKWTKSSRSDAVSHKPRRVPHMLPYAKIENEATLKNRVHSEKIKEDPTLLFNPSVKDGELKPVSHYASAVDDPVVAGLYSNFALRADLHDNEQVLDAGGQQQIGRAHV